MEVYNILVQVILVSTGPSVHKQGLIISTVMTSKNNEI